jgi:hypothetical protein
VDHQVQAMGSAIQGSVRHKKTGYGAGKGT